MTIPSRPLGKRLGQVVKYKTDACYETHINTVSIAPINIQQSVIHNQKLAYHLKILAVWKIQPMISIAHLELATNPVDNPYQRPGLNQLRSMEPENKVEPTQDHYMMEKLLGKRTRQGCIQHLAHGTRLPSRPKAFILQKRGQQASRAQG